MAHGEAPKLGQEEWGLPIETDRRRDGFVTAAQDGTGATHRQLKQMTGAGLLIEEHQGNQRLYSANLASPIFAELRGIVLRTVGLAEPLRDALAKLEKKIIAAFVFGSMAAGTARSEGDIDLLVVSELLDYPRVFEALQQAERFLARPVNPTVLSPDEWRRNLDDDESLVSRISAGPKIWVIGSDDVLK